MLSTPKVNILLIEDEDYDVRRVKNTLKPFQDRLIIQNIVSNGVDAIELIENNQNFYDVVIMDYQIAGGLTGEKLIREMKKIDHSLQIIVITKMTINISDFDFANRLMEAGAMWYCTKYPGDIEDYIYQPTDFTLSIFNAAEKKILETERRQSQRKLEQNVRDILAGKEIIGKSQKTSDLCKSIQKAAQTDTTILIRGKSGTGKELVAINIHYQSPRKYEKFVPINCGALPDELIESELFGFEKGSFTGAHAKKPGLLEIAHNGTAFLDEISELPVSAQVKLLRFLQEGEIDKIGRTEKLRVNVRIIAATNKNLEEQVREGKFREDLYYRLNVFSIWISSLPERREDIPDLVYFFMKKFSQEMSRETPVIEKDGMEILVNYNWPGNVRELQNVVQRLLLSDEKKIREIEVSRALGQISGLTAIQNRDNVQWDARNIISWKEMEANLRREYFQFVRRNSQSDADAARRLGIAPPNYHRMCKELGLK